MTRISTRQLHNEYAETKREKNGKQGPKEEYISMIDPYTFCCWEDRYCVSRYTSNILEVFMHKSTFSCNSSAWIQTKHFLEKETQIHQKCETSKIAANICHNPCNIDPFLRFDIYSFASQCFLNEAHLFELRIWWIKKEKEIQFTH